jgi:hypothetical protein
VLDFGSVRSGGGGAGGSGTATALRLRLRLRLRRVRLAASAPELSLAEEWTDSDWQIDSDRRAERC